MVVLRRSSIGRRSGRGLYGKRVGGTTGDGRASLGLSDLR